MEKSLIRKCLVVSAVNFSAGGPLTVLRDCLSSAAQSLSPEWQIIALVHDQKLIDEPRIRLVEIPDAKRSWLRRLYYEWFGFKKLSRELKPDLWLSLHDITPRVFARRQAVYCHNPSPFYQLSWREALMDSSFFLFNCFYRYLYQMFIRRNHWVVVQQSWLRTAFIRLYGVLPVIVAWPEVNLQAESNSLTTETLGKVFFYPAFPRVFKNFEIIGEAANLLKARGVDGFEIRLTLKGDENTYSRWLFEKYGQLSCMRFVGLQNQLKMKRHYMEASVVLFPSKLETWGLPISEAKVYEKPILVADLPYAHETVGTYEQVSFFPPDNAVILADYMQAYIEGRWQPAGATGVKPDMPFARNWNELWNLLIEGL